jgi:hypothetical protein
MYEFRPCAPRFPGDDPSAPKPEGCSHILRCGSRRRRGALCNPVPPKPLSLPVPEHLQYRRQRTAPTVRHLVHSYPACTYVCTYCCIRMYVDTTSTGAAFTSTIKHHFHFPPPLLWMRCGCGMGRGGTRAEPRDTPTDQRLGARTVSISSAATGDTPNADADVLVHVRACLLQYAAPKLRLRARERCPWHQGVGRFSRLSRT